MTASDSLAAKERQAVIARIYQAAANLTTTLASFETRLILLDATLQDAATRFEVVVVKVEDTRYGWEGVDVTDG